MRRFYPAHLKWKLAAAALMAGILLAWVLLDLPCLIRAATGIPCPSCGMSRAWLAVLRLDFSAAFSFHPMFWSVPVFGWLLLYDLHPLKRQWQNGLILGLLLAGYLGCYLIRLVAYLRGEIVL